VKTASSCWLLELVASISHLRGTILPIKSLCRFKRYYSTDKSNISL
jgi:hypothetical protein